MVRPKQEEQNARGQRDLPRMLSPHVEVLNQLRDLAKWQHKQRIVQTRRRDLSNDLQHVLVRSTSTVHREHGVARR